MKPSGKSRYCPERKAFQLLLKDCAAGFYQQIYFLGKDASHFRGNQLQEYGFVRTPSQGLKGTSCYTFKTKGTTIELYGSCASCYSENASVAFLRSRSRFYHWVSEDRCVAGLWTKADIETGTPESIFAAVTPLLQWWFEYEQWINDRFGETYREQCFREWRKINKSKSWLPPQEATRWLEQFLKNGSAHVRPKHFDETTEPGATVPDDTVAVEVVPIEQS